MTRRSPFLLPMIVALLTSAISLGANGQEAANQFRLPSFKTPDYDCDGLRSAILQRQPSSSEDAYDVVLQDQGGAEFMGDLAGMVGWKAKSTVAFVGTLTIRPCKADGGPAPIVIVGDFLKFEVTADGRLSYLSGSGTVTQGSSVTNLPIVATPVAPTKEQPKTPSKPSRVAVPPAKSLSGVSRGKAQEGGWCDAQADCASGLTCSINFCERGVDETLQGSDNTAQLKQRRAAQPAERDASDSGAARHTYRFKVIAYDQGAKVVRGELVETTEMKPGMFVDTGTNLQLKLASVDHITSEIRPGVLLTVTLALQNGEWKTVSVRKLTR